MGFNLSLYCEDCDAGMFVPRGHESTAIRAFDGRHYHHEKALYVDNGFMREPQWVIDQRAEEIFPPESEWRS